MLSSWQRGEATNNGRQTCSAPSLKPSRPKKVAWSNHGRREVPIQRTRFTYRPSWFSTVRCIDGRIAASIDCRETAEVVVSLFSKQAQVCPISLGKRRPRGSIEYQAAAIRKFLAFQRVGRIRDIRERMWCYNCFGGGMGSVENDRMPQSKRRIKRGMKSSTSFTNIAGDKYSGAPVYAEISAAGEARIVSEYGGSETLLGIVSVSHSGLIPVILSPVAKPSRLDADIISVSSMRIQKTADAESASVDEIAMKISDQEIIDKEDRRVPVKRGRRSWVRIIKKKTSGFLTQSLHRITQNGKVQQDPNRSQALSAHGSIDTGQPKPFEPATVEQENNLSPSHPGSSPAPNIHHSFHPSPARGMDRTNKNFKLRPSPAVQSHGSAPTSPRANEIEPSASSTSILHTQLPAHQPNRFHQPSSLESNRGRLHSRGQFRQPGTKTAAGYDTVLSVTGLVIILGCLVFSDRLCAIVCTSMWWYLLPRLRNPSKLQGYQSGVPADSEDIKGTAPSRSAIKGNKLDLQSSEYRKKVIMEGLLQRNHKFV